MPCRDGGAPVTYANVRSVRLVGCASGDTFTVTPDVATSYDVDGVLMPRPFKIVKIGPVGLYVQDVDAAKAFYTDKLGFVPTEEATWKGLRCSFLRTNTEHHSIALFPLELREALGASADPREQVANEP